MSHPPRHPRTPDAVADAIVAKLGAARAARAELARLARDHPALCVGYVLRDEATGDVLTLAPMHRAWHELIGKHNRLVIWSHTESGKTQEISVGRTLWEIGRDPSLRVLILSNTHGQAVKIMRSVRKYVESSDALHAVFPDLVADPDGPWTDSAITVKRSVISKDPTVQATGVHGNITGARLDLVIVDDILDWENTRTADERQKTWDWYQATVSGRLTERARVVVVGTAYHPDDFLHRVAKQWGNAVRYPVVADDNGEPRWPERWPAARIEARRAELGPLEFARQMLCVARDDSQARFRREWIQKCLARGEGRDYAYALESVPGGYRTYTGVDLGVQQHAGADLTVAFTICVHPDGSREVLNVESGRWAGPEILDRITDIHRRYQSVVVIENVAAQDFILQFLRSRTAIPMRPFTTGRTKAHPEFGVESLAVELANGKWIIPNRGGKASPEVEAWIQEMLYYTPTSHTGDRLMASWFAREGERLGRPPPPVGWTRLDLGVR